MSVLQTTFQRFEYKYWVTEAVAQEILRAASPFLRADDMAKHGQRNTSLYLDSPDRDFLRAHLDSSPDRLKLRVRAYGDPPSGPAFFEIKRKVKAVCIKRRAILPMEQVASLLSGAWASLPKLRSAEEERTLADFLYIMTVRRAEPHLLVTCRREAFSSVEPSENLRLTVDREIAYQEARGPSLRGDPRGWIVVCGMGTYQPEASSLIEVKFRGVAPHWLEELVQIHNLRPLAFSKYVAAACHYEEHNGALSALDFGRREG